MWHIMTWLHTFKYIYLFLIDNWFTQCIVHLFKFLHQIKKNCELWNISSIVQFIAKILVLQIIFSLFSQLKKMKHVRYVTCMESKETNE